MQVLCNHIDRLFEGTCDVPQLLAPTTFAGAHLTRMQPQARAKYRLQPLPLTVSFPFLACGMRAM